MSVRFVFLFLVNFFAIIPAFSHPVSFEDSVSLMSFNSKQMREFNLNYSLTHRFALSYAYLKDDFSEFHIPRGNILLKRWNELESQANIYLSLGSGIEKTQGQSGSVSLGEIMLDWESRKYYISLDHRYLYRHEKLNLVASEDSLSRSKGRFGFAPFLAEYDELNIWFIAQLDKYDFSENLEAKQFLRFYIRNVLWEVGSDFNGNMNFNFMMHL